MSRPPAGRRPGRPDTRQQIVSAATTAFAADGYSNSSMRGIAARAGVDPALLHHYFGSKRLLFEAVIQPAYAIRERLVAMADRGASVEDLLEVLLSSCEDPTVGPAVMAAARSVSDSKAPSCEAIPRHRTPHPACAPPETSASSRPDHQHEPTDSDHALRRSLLAADVLGLVLARYVLRVDPLATAPHDEVISAFAPVLADHLCDRRSPRPSASLTE